MKEFRAALDDFDIIWYLALVLQFMRALLFFVFFMLSKNKRPYDPDELPPPARLRRNVEDLFLSNTVSANRAQELLNDISDVGMRDFSRLRNPLGKNNSRRLKTKFLKRSQWPKSYWQQIRAYDLKTQQETWQWCAFLLPSEYVEMLVRLGLTDVVLEQGGFDVKTKEHVNNIEAAVGEKILGLGLWGDGVPCNWDRTETVETLALNLPGQTGKYKTLRLPITSISKKQISPNTFDDMLDVIAKDFQRLAAGIRMQERYDGRPWRKTDAERRKKAGQPIGVKGALAEVRADWQFMAHVFHFPQWNEKKGCCWKCTCTPDEARSLLMRSDSYEENIYIYIYTYTYIDIHMNIHRRCIIARFNIEIYKSIDNGFVLKCMMCFTYIYI